MTVSVQSKIYKIIFLYICIMDWFEKLRKKLKNNFDETAEVNEDSDLPIHEHFTKQKNIQSISRKRKK